MSTWIGECLAIYPLGGLLIVGVLLWAGFMLGWIAKGEKRG